MLPVFDSLRVLAVGGVTHDRFGESVRAGGSAYYAARCWSALGARARLLAAVGTDFALRSELEGLDVELATSGTTICFANEATRAVAGRTIAEPSSLPTGWRDSDAVLLAPVFGEIDVTDWFDAVNAPWVGLMLQGLVRGAGPSDERLPNGRRVMACRPGLEDGVWRRLSLVVLSEEDLAELGQAAAASELERIRALVPLVVWTRGAAGSLIYDGDTTWEVGVARARAVDTTGAGDVFASAMLLWLAAGSSVQEAACAGSAAASIVVEGWAADGIEALRDRVESRMKAVPVCAIAR